MLCANERSSKPVFKQAAEAVFKSARSKLKLELLDACFLQLVQMKTAIMAKCEIEVRFENYYSKDKEYAK